MARFLPALLAVALFACAHKTVRLEVAASPAVSLQSTTVAVVAQDRACRPVADALIGELTRSAQFTVDPRAEVRLVVFGCGVDIGWTLHQEVDVTGVQASDTERADLIGRGHAALSVSTTEAGLAHLVGSARDGHIGAGVSEMFRTRRAMQHRLTESVASDLVAQLNPLPMQFERRIYPRAPDGTVRQLHTLAVLAERDGDLALAHQLAMAAHAERPSGRTADYVTSLERRLHVQTVSTVAPIPSL